MTEHKGIADSYKKLDDETVKKINKLLQPIGWTVGDIFRARYLEYYDLETKIKIAEIKMQRSPSSDKEKAKETIINANNRQKALLGEGIQDDISEWF